MFIRSKASNLAAAVSFGTGRFSRNSKRKKNQQPHKIFLGETGVLFARVEKRDSHPSPATPHCLGVVIVCAHILEPTVSYESPFERSSECAFP
jgi:hypothetical protein